MKQPIIDPNKVNDWLQSMQGVFAANALGTWLVVGFTLAFLAFVAVMAWDVERKARHRV